MSQIDWIEAHEFIQVLGVPSGSSAVKSLCRKHSLREEFESGLVYYENEQDGLTLIGEDDVIRTVMFFAEGKDEFQQYRGKLLQDLTFDSKRKDVRKKLGLPASHIEENKDDEFPALAHAGQDKYTFEECRLYLTYSVLTGKIELVTLEIKGSGTFLADACPL